MVYDLKLVAVCVLGLIIGMATILPFVIYTFEESNKPQVDVQAILGDQPPLSFNLTYSTLVIIGITTAT
jgi:hypothetical protein